MKYVRGEFFTAIPFDPHETRNAGDAVVIRMHYDSCPEAAGLRGLSADGKKDEAELSHWNSGLELDPPVKPGSGPPNSRDRFLGES
jgi:hypothetical protein